MPKWISVFLIVAIAHMQFAVCGSCGRACTSKSASNACCSDSIQDDHSEHNDDSCHHHCQAPTHRENEQASHSLDSAEQTLCVAEATQCRARMVESIGCQCTCPLCISHRRAHIAANHLLTQLRQDLSKISLSIQATYLTPSYQGLDGQRAVACVSFQPSRFPSILDSLCRLRI